jgi:hypothetical protein
VGLLDACLATAVDSDGPTASAILDGAPGVRRAGKRCRWAAPHVAQPESGAGVEDGAEPGGDAPAGLHQTGDGAEGAEGVPHDDSGEHGSAGGRDIDGVDGCMATSAISAVTPSGHVLIQRSPCGTD